MRFRSASPRFGSPSTSTALDFFAMNLFPDPITDGDWHLEFHAIGVMTMAWNNLEDQIPPLISKFSEMHPRMVEVFLDKAGNVSRADLLLWCVEHSLADDRTVDAVRYLVMNYGLCRENRNILIHAQLGRTEDGHLELIKRTNRGIRRAFPSDIATLREVATSIDDFASYAYRILWVLREETMASIRQERDPSWQPPPWPDKPPPPRKLGPRQPA